MFYRKVPMMSQVLNHSDRLELEGKYLLVVVVSLDDVKLADPGQVFTIPHWEYKQPASLI